ncbi:S8 family serine peptidase [Emcibacter sp.]|uniref:S8 family serine peptidase n=1 Tax=Emcibacter sp. TaxID=1979954 RepID=UPI002AA7AE99|nr:S8 family serine peptidase [Emcibacter sp.]
MPEQNASATDTEEEAEKAAEEAAEEAAEQAAQEAEEAAEEAAEQAAQEAEEAAEEAAEQAAQEAEEAAEEAAEQAAQEAEEAAEEAAEQAAQEAEEAAEEAAEQAAQKAEEAAEEAAAQAAQEAEEAAEEAAEQAAQEAEEAAEKAAEDAAEAAEKAAEKVAEELEKAAERAAKQSEKAAEEAEKVTEKAAHDAQKAAEKADSEDHDHPGRALNEKGISSEFAGNLAERLRDFREISDEDGFEAVADELLILVEKGTEFENRDNDLRIEDSQYLDGLGLVLVRLKTVEDGKLEDLAAGISEKNEDVDVDLNHLFLPESENPDQPATLVQQVGYSGNLDLAVENGGNIQIGLIDTLVDREHSAFLRGDIITNDLVQYKQSRPQEHGTAVASILVGDEQGVFRGLIPGAKLFAASVFFKTPSGKTAATTESLILALDWLVRQKVRVINMSLSGPPNKLLEIAIQRVREKGSVIVAAVGNGGPVAKPLYPAAYAGVIAVTAVDGTRKVYLRANRGRHVAFSAPGVDIPAARAGGGYDIQTGTSIAAPFVSAILADMVSRNGMNWNAEYLDVLRKNAIDLGQPGFDNIYGHGLIQALKD